MKVREMLIRKSLLILWFFSLILYPREAYAYVDPGTQGYIYQVLFLAFSAMVAIRIFFRNKLEAAIGSVRDFIKNLFRGSST